MQGTAFVFINWHQAVRFGHVGWGFSLNEQKSDFYFGSIDHLLSRPWWDLPGWVRYAHVPPSAQAGAFVESNLDWWGTEGSYDEMVRIMLAGHHIRYHAFCALSVADARPEKAIACAEAVAASGWSMLLNNCVHQTYTGF